MENTLNLNRINSYAKNVSEKVVDGIFEERNTNVGTADVKTLTEIEQVNLFVIQEIFNTWNIQIASSKSEYFYYENEEVKRTFEKFVNALSQNISLNKEQLQKLIEKAIRDCIYILLCPYDYYYDLLSNLKAQQLLNIENWVKYTRYIRINSDLKDRINDTLLESQSYDDISKIMNTSCDKIIKAPEPIEPIFDLFKKYVDLNIDELFLKKNEAEEPVSLADNLEKKDQVTMNDALENKTYSSELHDNISINQRFMFIQELFDNDNNLYDLTLSEIDKLDDEQQAQQYIKEHISSKYDWDFECEEVIEFMRVIKLRFQ